MRVSFGRLQRSHTRKEQRRSQEKQVLSKNSSSCQTPFGGPFSVPSFSVSCRSFLYPLHPRAARGSRTASTAASAPGVVPVCLILRDVISSFPSRGPRAVTFRVCDSVRFAPSARSVHGTGTKVRISAGSGFPPQSTAVAGVLRPGCSPEGRKLPCRRTAQVPGSALTVGGVPAAGRAWRGGWARKLSGAPFSRPKGIRQRYLNRDGSASWLAGWLEDFPPVMLCHRWASAGNGVCQTQAPTH